MSAAKRQNIALKVSLIIGGTGTRTAAEIGTANPDLKIKIVQIAEGAEVQNILTKRNKKTMKAEVSVVKIKNCKFFDRELDTRYLAPRSAEYCNYFDKQ